MNSTPRLGLTALVSGFLIIINPVSAQDMTPLDSLYHSDHLSLSSRVIFKPIQIWQKFSYRSPALNCQFEKSCSNFMVDAIQTRGVLPGLVIGTDRIVRCNPAARHYHFKSKNPHIGADGRLVEKVSFSKEIDQTRRAAIASGLSLIPGLGRTYAGNPIDGIYSFIFVSGFTIQAYQHHSAGNTLQAYLTGGLACLFWLADIYGSYRTVHQSALAP